MANKEQVLMLGAEGGGAFIYRVPTADGGWEFTLSGSTMEIDDDGIDSWRGWKHGPFTTLESALEGVGGDPTFWLLLSPFDLHEEYRAAIWGLIEQHKDKLDGRRLGRWQEACFPRDEQRNLFDDDDRKPR